MLMSARRGAAVAALCALLASPAAAFPLLYDGNGGALLTTALGANLSLTPSEGGSIVAGALLHANAGVASTALAVAGAATVGGSLAVAGALSAASLTIGGAAFSAPSPSPPACVPPGATGLFYNGSAWVCACAARWSGASCTVPSAAVALLAGGCSSSPCDLDGGTQPGRYYFVAGKGTAASLLQALAVAVHPLTGNVYVTSANWACHVSPFYQCVAMVTPAGVVTQVDRTWTSPTQSYAPFALSTSGFPFVTPSDSLFPGANNAQPGGLAFDSSGTLYVVDDYSGNGVASVYRVSPAGEVTPLSLTWPDTITSSGEKRLYGIAVSGSTLYLTGSNYNTCVMRGALTGTSLSMTVLAGVCGNNPGATDGTGSEATFGQPKGIAVDSSGNVFVGDYTNNKLRKITPGGVVTTAFTQTSGAFKSNDGVAVDASDNVYFATGSSLMMLSSAGAVSVVAASGFNELAGVAIDAATGIIYAADKGGAGYVWKFV